MPKKKIIERNDEDVISDGLILIRGGILTGSIADVLLGYETISGEKLTWEEEKPKSKLEKIRENIKKKSPKKTKPVEESLTETEEEEISQVANVDDDQFTIKRETIKGGKRFGGRQPTWFDNEEEFEPGKVEIVTTEIDPEEQKKNAFRAKKTSKSRKGAPNRPFERFKGYDVNAEMNLVDRNSKPA